jgi:hypothetical protein
MGGITRYIEVNDKGLVIEYNGETKTIPLIPLSLVLDKS